MRALTVDDEQIMLNALTLAVKESPDISSVAQFTSCTATLEWAKTNPIDIAFLDISMRGMGGLALAERLLEIQPNCKIVFCTGFSEYAVEAFKIHVSGYLLKPITAKAVQAEIDHIKQEKAKEKTTYKLLTVKCFGNFEVIVERDVASRGNHNEIHLVLLAMFERLLEERAFLIDPLGGAVNVLILEIVLAEVHVCPGRVVIHGSVALLSEEDDLDLADVRRVG